MMANRFSFPFQLLSLLLVCTLTLPPISAHSGVTDWPEDEGGEVLDSEVLAAPVPAQSLPAVEPAAAARPMAMGLSSLQGGLSPLAERVRDLTSLAGVRNNQLVGYGLVVGLDDTGDQTSQVPFTVQSLENMLKQFGITIPDNVNPQVNNVAAVSVHAELPPFAKPGSRLDVTISSIGNAESLRGGSLLMTPLKGADGQVYAIAQGNLVVSGFGAAGADGSSITVNVPTAGRIPNGATIEREVASNAMLGDVLVFNLHTPNFTTARRISDTLNGLLGLGTARAIDAVSVEVRAPTESDQRVAFISELENIRVEPGEPPARVIINSRTGTVVIGSNVKVLPAAVAHGSLAVTISEQPAVSQPEPFSDGETVVVPQSQVEIEEDPAKMFLFPAGVSLNDIVQAVNRVGAAPGDLVAIMEALSQAGALRAQLVVI